MGGVGYQSSVSTDMAGYPAQSRLGHWTGTGRVGYTAVSFGEGMATDTIPDHLLTLEYSHCIHSNNIIIIIPILSSNIKGRGYYHSWGWVI